MRVALPIAGLAWGNLLKVGFAQPFNDLVGCANSWDAFGIACKSVGFCSNAPKVIAGDMYSAPPRFRVRHTELEKRASTGYTRWCQVGSRTYVVLQTVHAVTPANVVSDLLDQAIAYVQSRAAAQDGIIGDQGYRRLGADALTLRVYDANNHHLTWGVLGAALQALRDYMSQHGHAFGTVSFSVFDGENQTGQGSIG